VDDFRAWDAALGGVTGGNPLHWDGYDDVLASARARSGADESVVTGVGMVRPGPDGPGLPVAVISSIFEFVGGSMGLASGERVVRAFDRARHERLPVLVIARSGGARMQEGMLALVQMARVADAARRHADAGLLQVAYLRSPTTGGVYASFASLVDVLWAEPDALIGFAGPRVVEVVTGEAPASDSHRAEGAFAAGVVDAVLEPEAARAELALLLAATRTPGRRTAPEAPAPPAGVPDAEADPWDVVTGARAPERPSGREWLDRVVASRVEIHGDRAGATDPVVLAGVGTTAAGTPIAFLALDRHAGDGRPRPAGYRTAQRLLALAARLRLPVVTFVDTPGADPAEASDHGGLAGEIARMLAAVTGHPAPTVSIVVGEGGSGGALAFAATDRLYLLEDAFFSVIAPEGAAAILERDPSQAPALAARLRLTARDMMELHIADGIVVTDETGDRVRAMVEDALATANPGDGRARFDEATRAWLRST
jgi:acetyl-CoA carboxylase carboxyl transferase subunit beta